MRLIKEALYDEVCGAVTRAWWWMWKRSAAETRLVRVSAVKRAALWHEEEEEEGPPPDPAHQSIISVHFEPVTGIPFQTELQTWVWGGDSLQNHTHGSNKGLYAVLMLSSSIHVEVYIIRINGLPEHHCKVADICIVTAHLLNAILICLMVICKIK